MATEPFNRFIIRVYALIFKDEYHLLLSDEFMLDTRMIKFPGGGIHFGEGPADCLKREALEEFGQEIEILSHYYTTDYFQKALFCDNAQLISIYYKVRFKEQIRFRISEAPFDFPEMVNGSQRFRWVDLRNSNSAGLTFPIDKIVFEKLQNEIV
ncbi:MAG: NUDIX domain-containing protein [Bacteroidales bacterium]|nr:NUDIX domain-containing protein [Bacteroidales bacterium]